MTYLEALLEGAAVEWKPLGEIGKVCMCRRIFREQTSPRGDIPFYKIGTFGKEADAYISYELYEEYRLRYPFPKKGDVLISASGTIGRLVVYDGAPAYFQDSNIVWIDNDESLVLNRFLYYYYGIVHWKTDKGTIERLYNRNLEKVLIPLPPLAVQERIVEILDKFTALIEALETELTLRNRQYAYYRNRLLRFGKEVEWRPLGEVAELKRGRVISKKYIEENAGQYPVYSSQTLNNGEIGRINTFDFDCETVTWTTDGVYAGTVFYRKGKFSITNICGMITILDTQRLNYLFLFFWLSIEARKHVNPSMGNAKVMNHQMAKILIPLPPLAVQEQIVSILDKFHTLVHSISEGLPAEIALRRRQYEYYRNQLLRFPR